MANDVEAMDAQALEEEMAEVGARLAADAYNLDELQGVQAWFLDFLQKHLMLERQEVMVEEALENERNA